MFMNLTATPKIVSISSFNSKFQFQVSISSFSFQEAAEGMVNPHRLKPIRQITVYPSMRSWSTPYIFNFSISKPDGTKSNAALKSTKTTPDNNPLFAANTHLSYMDSRAVMVDLLSL